LCIRRQFGLAREQSIYLECGGLFTPAPTGICGVWCDHNGGQAARARRRFGFGAASTPGEPVGCGETRDGRTASMSYQLPVAGYWKLVTGDWKLATVFVDKNHAGH